MKVLVIPDCHLKPWMFAQANTIMKKGIADKAVCLMDLADDFGVHDDAQYLETYETAIAFAKEHPDTLWCYGNHDLSYIWGKPETGYHPEKRGLVCQEIKKLTNTLPKKSQLAYIHKIDKTLFMHGGLANLFIQLRVAPQNRKNVLAASLFQLNFLYQLAGIKLKQCTVGGKSSAAMVQRIFQKLCRIFG